MNIYKELSKDEINYTIYINQYVKNSTIKRYIHSKYNPIKEAEEWAEKNYDLKKKIYVIFGGGLLYHAKELIKKLDNNCKVIVIETSIDIYNMIINEEIFEELKRDSRFSLIVAKSNFDILNYLKKALESKSLTNIKICKLESYENCFNYEFKEYLKAVKKMIIHKSINDNTSFLFSIDYTKNIINNLFIAQNSHYIMKFKNKFEDKVAIIVSAGPSLEKNIDLLKGNEDKFIIISGGRTLRSLLEKSIVPHFVVSIDPAIENFELFKPVLNCTVPLVCSFVNNKEITNNYLGKKIFYNDCLVPNLDKQILRQNIDGISGGGSVATYQTSFAHYIGCKTIIMIGQDLAYTDNKFHADIASDEINIVKNDADLIKVKGIKTDYVYTSHSLNMYKDWFENYAYLYKDIEFINCSEGGAFLEGLIHMELSEAIIKYAKKSENHYEKVDKILSISSEKISYKDFLENINEMLKATMKIIELSKKSITLIHGLEKTNNRSADLKKLTKIDKAMKKYTKITMPAALLIKNELEYFDEVNPNNNDDIIKVNLRFYDTLNKTYSNFRRIIESTIDFHEK